MRSESLKIKKILTNDFGQNKRFYIETQNKDWLLFIWKSQIK